MRQICIVMVAFVLALSPLHDGGGDAAGDAGGVTVFKSAAASASPGLGNGSVAAVHGHAGIDACPAKTGHCVPAASDLAADNHGFFMATLKSVTHGFGNALRGRLRPLPLLPPPESA